MIEIISQSNTEPVTVQEVKDYSKITYNADNALIASFIKAARAVLESYTGRNFIIKRQYLTIQNDNGTRTEITLDNPPFVTLHSVYKINEYTGELTLLTASTDYFVYAGKLKIKVPWFALKIDYSSGYTAQNLPEEVKTAIYQQISLWDLNRAISTELSSEAKKTLAGLRINFL